jgi:hypothetical protein
MAAKIKAKRISTLSKAASPAGKTVKIPAKSPGSRRKSRVRADKRRPTRSSERSPALPGLFHTPWTEKRGHEATQQDS